MCFNWLEGPRRKIQLPPLEGDEGLTSPFWSLLVRKWLKVARSTCVRDCALSIRCQRQRKRRWTACREEDEKTNRIWSGRSWRGSEMVDGRFTAPGRTWREWKNPFWSLHHYHHRHSHYSLSLYFSEFMQSGLWEFWLFYLEGFVISVNLKRRNCFIFICIFFL